MANLETILKKTNQKIEKLEKEKTDAEEKKKEMIALADKTIADLNGQIKDATSNKKKIEAMLKEQEAFMAEFETGGKKSKKTTIEEPTLSIESDENSGISY